MPYRSMTSALVKSLGTMIRLARAALDRMLARYRKRLALGIHSRASGRSKERSCTTTTPGTRISGGNVYCTSSASGRTERSMRGRSTVSRLLLLADTRCVRTEGTWSATSARPAAVTATCSSSDGSAASPARTLRIHVSLPVCERPR